jgi:hypothetical protein
MRGLFCAVGLITAVVVVADRGLVRAQQAGTASVEVTGAAPGSALEIALNGGKIAETTTNTQGEATSVLDLANLGKVRVNVFVDRCVDGKVVKIQLVTEGNQPPPVDEGCDRKPAGWFWSDKGRVVIDVKSGTVSTPGPSKALLIGGGAAAAAGLGLATGGGSDTTPATNNPTPPSNPNPSTPNPPAFTPAGPYQVMTDVSIDISKHAGPIGLGVSGALIAALNSPIQFTGPNLQNWVTVSGDYDASTGRFSATGRGTVAGFSNVGVRFEGTITTSGALSGTYTMGTGGELPGGQSITYTVQGQKQ